MLIVPETLVPAYWHPANRSQPCLPVELEDIPSVLELVEKMAQYCRSLNGVGLAAPQVSIYKQLAIVMVKPRKVDLLINPRIVRFGGRDLLMPEGCLSLPPDGNTQRVLRSETIEIECGTLEDPFARVRSEHSGMEARVIQHEIDHCEPEGEVFYIDRLKPMAAGQVKRKFYKHMRETEEARMAQRFPHELRQ